MTTQPPGKAARTSCLVLLTASFGLGLAGSGCVSPPHPIFIPEHAITAERLPQSGIKVPLQPPSLGPPIPSTDQLPATPPESAPGQESKSPASSVNVDDVLASVSRHFPLVLAAEQEFALAQAQRLVAEGAYDLTLRGRGSSQGGTFPNNRLDALFEQATPLYGVSMIAGYRFGYDSFPVYYGDRLTANDGEFRAGVQVPLLKDAAIDRRRAVLEQAKINQDLADPLVRRVRIDALRNAAKAYWNWIAAGEQIRVAQSLLTIARERQNILEEQFKRGQIANFVVLDNRRLLIEREGALVGAERRWQQATFELSLYWRDAGGNPIVATADQLPRSFLDQQPVAPSAQLLLQDVDLAWRQRPELLRFQLQRERMMVDLRLAENQLLPAVNFNVFGSQDVGPGKKSTGLFALERTVYEAAVTMEVPLQRRDARGKLQAANAALAQLLAQERYARDTIQTEVQDAHSNMDRTLQRLRLAREEQLVAEQVADLERERFRKGQGNLLELNLRELAAAGARVRVIEALADFQRATADYRAAIGWLGPN